MVTQTEDNNVPKAATRESIARTADILARRGRGETWKAIADVYGISKTRARQIVMLYQRQRDWALLQNVPHELLSAFLRFSGWKYVPEDN